MPKRQRAKALVLPLDHANAARSRKSCANGNHEKLAIAARSREVRNLLSQSSAPTPMHDDPAESESIQRTFTEDHRRFIDLGRAIVRALESRTIDVAESLWAELEKALSIHLHAEDQFMIPALGRVRSREARALAAEHRLLRERLAEIGARFKQNQMQVGLVRAFVHELDAHARHEEKIFYEWADAWLDDKERALLFAYRAAARTDSSAASSSSTRTGLVR